jgi:hypothetical protein
MPVSPNENLYDQRKHKRRWIPAFAGMTTQSAKVLLTSTLHRPEHKKWSTGEKGDKDNYDREKANI